MEICLQKFLEKRLRPKQVRIIFAETIFAHSVYHDTESLSFLGPTIWDLLPMELKQSESLDSFKLIIKKCVPLESPCRLCRTYMSHVEFL